MAHLWDNIHPYYCNEGNYYAAGNDQPFERYESWKDFHEAEGNSDFDMNLLFRWDWKTTTQQQRDYDETDPEYNDLTDKLMLYWMGQRKGLYRWTEVKVRQGDEGEIKAWLQARWEHLVCLWTPVSQGDRADIPS